MVEKHQKNQKKNQKIAKISTFSNFSNVSKKKFLSFQVYGMSRALPQLQPAPRGMWLIKMSLDQICKPMTLVDNPIFHQVQPATVIDFGEFCQILTPIEAKNFAPYISKKVPKFLWSPRPWKRHFPLKFRGKTAKNGGKNAK